MDVDFAISQFGLGAPVPPSALPARRAKHVRSPRPDVRPFAHVEAADGARGEAGPRLLSHPLAVRTAAEMRAIDALAASGCGVPECRRCRGRVYDGGGGLVGAAEAAARGLLDPIGAALRVAEVERELLERGADEGGAQRAAATARGKAHGCRAMSYQLLAALRANADTACTGQCIR